MSSFSGSKDKKIIKLIAGAVVLLILYTAAQLGFDLTGELGSTYAPASPGFYRVVSVSDGDTFAVSMNGVKEDVRLVGVDTPETHHPRKPVQCYGPEASGYMKRLIDNGQVRLQADPQQGNRDRYGRLLRYAFLEDGRELNELLVKEGYALATNFNTEKKRQLKALQQKARESNKGLWAKCRVTEQNGYLQTGPAQ